MFKEIVTLISDLASVADPTFVIGAKLQAGHQVQDAPVRRVLVLENGGVPYFYPNTDMVDMAIQILCRAATYWEARDDAWIVYDAVHGTSGWNMPRLVGVGADYLVTTVNALYAPQYLGVDDNRRHLFSTNYIFRVEEGSCEPTSGSGSI
ncbi:MAG: hypothetical protein IMZ57_04215 [Acidobacteria bacterium]|nr:hypothetical protein [Acidobacteriota bacterium]